MMYLIGIRALHAETPDLGKGSRVKSGRLQPESVLMIVKGAER